MHAATQMRVMTQEGTLRRAPLNAPAAEQLRPYSAVYVLPSGDLRSRQAAVRLRRVFGLEGVAHVADAN